MASVKKLRNQLGLSQPAFAGLLNCSPGQLSMAESGLRSLPPASLAIAAALEQAIATKKAARPVNKPPNEKIIALLSKHIRKCTVQKESMEITALKLSEKLEAVKQMLTLSEAFTAMPATTYVSDIQLQMAVLIRKASKKAQVYGEQLMQLQLSIAGLQGEITKAEELKTYQHN